MRELERESTDTPHCARLAIIGRGRLGTALAEAVADTGRAVIGPLGRDVDIADAEIVLLCVPDAEIAAVAAALPAGRLVGHCSGATGLQALAPHERFSLHPLMTVTGPGARFTGAAAAIDGDSPRGLAAAGELALVLGMVPVRIAPTDRVAYHTAASLAANFLITLEAGAERMAASAGLDRALLAPLVRQSVENWVTLGAARALTGPLARGDEATVAAQRDAVAQRAPELLDLFDALADATRALAATRVIAA
jgi:predicted short-subunit dehydrogenase-like oxidoreductase (DUF2520 family)